MVTIGADPEVFLCSTKSGEVIPSCGLIGGTKEEPQQCEDLGTGYAYQEDNVMLEFNIPPTTMPDMFTASIRDMLSWCADFVRTKELVIDVQSERLFSNDKLRSPNAQRFGCAPDMDAYSTTGMPRAGIDAGSLVDGDAQWRFAGGHVHIGFDRSQVEAPDFVIAKLCDLYLGLPCVGADDQNRRRQLYGLPGLYRRTKWGIEYRTLSNFWIFNEATTHDIAVRALNLGILLEERDTDFLRKLHAEVPWDTVRAAITNSDEEAAADVIAFVETELGVRGISG